MTVMLRYLSGSSASPALEMGWMSPEHQLLGDPGALRLAESHGQRWNKHIHGNQSKHNTIMDQAEELLQHPRQLLVVKIVG